MNRDEEKSLVAPLGTWICKLQLKKVLQPPFTIKFTQAEKILIRITPDFMALNFEVY